MAITIGSNTIDGPATINFNTNGGTLVQQVNNSWGKQATYPAFNAGGTAGWTYISQMGTGGSWAQPSSWNGLNDSWIVTQSGQGSYGFNTTYCRYYAPVTGYYQFGMTIYYLDDANSYSYTHMNFGKNGGLNYNNGRHGHSIFNYPSHGSYAHGINMESIIYCNQGDYVSPQPYINNASQRIYFGHFHFYGHLCP